VRAWILFNPCLPARSDLKARKSFQFYSTITETTAKPDTFFDGDPFFRQFKLRAIIFDTAAI
jgi:hypothetical protein